jgi:hypothetical protein
MAPLALLRGQQLLDEVLQNFEMSEALWKTLSCHPSPAADSQLAKDEYAKSCCK